MIETVLLAMVFTCEKCHIYIYRKDFQIESDHKTLENIQNKIIAQAPLRLQRMLLWLKPYDTPIIYKPGKEIRVIDNLSKVQPTQVKEIQRNLTWYSYISAEANRFKKATEEEELIILKHMIINGCPDGLITKDKCIVIPWNMQNNVIQRIHDAHQGIEKCKFK